MKQYINGELVDMTPKEVEEFNQHMRSMSKTKYQRDRVTEYPPITDYLDGIVKGDQAQVQAYIDACLAVKAKYPKPTE